MSATVTDIRTRMPAGLFKVVEPMPEHGAVPGDYLVIDRTHPKYPATITRHLRAVPDLTDPRLRFVRSDL